MHEKAFRISLDIVNFSFILNLLIIGLQKFINSFIALHEFLDTIDSIIMSEYSIIGNTAIETFLFFILRSV